MPDLEKVIKGLECCFGEIAICAQNECPYYEGHNDYECERKLMMDALELLKAQEPRVMALEELEDWDSPIYFEEIDMNEYYALIETVELAAGNKGTFVFMNVMPGEHHRRAWDGAYYNIFWRCWTSRPTDEQMEAVKWE